jgi:hypothetical protein
MDWLRDSTPRLGETEESLDFFTYNDESDVCCKVLRTYVSVLLLIERQISKMAKG